MQTVNQLIHAKWIITCEENNQALENHALAIQDSKIMAILPSDEAKQQYQADEEQYFNEHAILPGLINSHTHLAMNAFRGMADDLELMDWLNNYIWPAEGKWVSHDFVYDASQLAIGEMIRCGTTCFNDMYFFLGATAEAAREAGVRAHIGMTVIDVPTAWAQTTDEYFAKAEEFYQQYKETPLVTPTLAPHSTYTVSEDNLLRVKTLAEKHGLKTNIHLQESAGEVDGFVKANQIRPLERLNKLGMVNENLIAVHMTQVSDSDLDILGKHQPNIVHCPESNMKLASGICEVEKLRAQGINVALGTDGAASNNDLDMIGEMRSAALIGKIPQLNPCAMPAETVLKMATINGAKTLGIDKETGSLSVGKSADMMAINLAELETQPIYHPVSAIVYNSSRHQVTDVWVKGRQLMKQRQLLTLDEQSLLEKAQRWQQKITSQTVSA